MPKKPEQQGERCVRCGSVGGDRRTLWMSCFYAMEELDIPFEQVKVVGRFHQKTGTEEITEHKFKVPVFSESSEPVDRSFSLLHVCKRCRSEWLAAIKGWFESAPQGIDHDSDGPRPQECGSGIFIRELGQIREITEEQWRARNPGREPYRVKQPSEERKDQ